MHGAHYEAWVITTKKGWPMSLGLKEFLIGFVMPWALLGWWLAKKDARTVIVVAPFTTLVGTYLNDLWYAKGFGYFLPDIRGAHSVIGAAACELGAYAVIGSAMIVAKKNGIAGWIAIPVAALAMTLVEVIGLYLVKCVVYSDGWNFAWTWIAYVGGFSIVNAYHHVFEYLSKRGASYNT
ncbi:hypothetical protein JZ785_20935 [Alicyclobacillus curvatus]|nr:hypothetical protein JZ785_20935 [Alicyclobacillus curvatus]